MTGAFGSPQIVDYTPRYLFSIELKKFCNSYTSYQFPNPFPPSQDPLSRLEFPIDQWFVGLNTGYKSTLWSIYGKVSTNINMESGLKMQDSDWDDETRPGQKTIFSESQCRLNTSVLADVGIVVGRGIGSWSFLRPVVGYRYQYFYFTSHDGEQYDISGVSMDLPGDGIDFKQEFNHFYGGGVLETVFNTPGSIGYSMPVKVSLQADLAMVRARNEDYHLLRAGERLTVEHTTGHCWHVGLSTDFVMNSRLKISLEGDFKRIITMGDHRLTNPLFAIDFSFDGSKVWSDQATLSANAQLDF
jgi:hypothetical protein